MDDHIVDANKKVDRIIKAAREAGWTDMQLSMAAPAEIERLSRFYTIAFKAGMERAAEIAAIHSQYPIENDFDRGYSKGSRDASDRIRAHAKNQPESTHDGSVTEGN